MKRLNATQIRILESLVAGRTVNQVALDIGIGLSAVQSQLRRAKEVMGSTTTYQLIAQFVVLRSEN